VAYDRRKRGKKKEERQRKNVRLKLKLSLFSQRKERVREKGEETFLHYHNYTSP